MIRLAQLEKPELEWLASEWQSLGERVGIPAAAQETLYAEIVAKYSEPQRAYHNLSHIYSMLQLVEKETTPISRPDLLRLAIWYHDIIYQAIRKDNEQKSAELASKRLSPYCTPGTLVLLEQMIESTKLHVPLSNNPDTPILLDIDLAVLAAERSIYATYTKAIRKEYKIFPDLLYKPGRRKVLKHFLGMERIYYCAAHKDWETIARENLSWEANFRG